MDKDSCQLYLRQRLHQLHTIFTVIGVRYWGDAAQDWVIHHYPWWGRARTWGLPLPECVRMVGLSALSALLVYRYFKALRGLDKQVHR